MVAERPDEEKRSQLHDRQLQVMVLDPGKPLLRGQARVEQIKHPRGEGKEKQRAGDAMQDRHPTGQRQTDLEKDRGEAEVLRTNLFRGRARHFEGPGPYIRARPIIMKSKANPSKRSNRWRNPLYVSQSPAPPVKSAIPCCSASPVAKCSARISRSSCSYWKS